MATTLQSKINELEARLRAENESRATDPMIRSLNSDKPNPRHPLPFDRCKNQNNGTDQRRGKPLTCGQLHQERTASPGAPPIPPRRRIQSPSVAQSFRNENFNKTIDLPQPQLSQTIPYVSTRQQQHQRSVSVERSSFSDARAYYRHTRAAAAGSQTGSAIPVSSARGRLVSSNSDANNKPSKRKPVQSGIVENSTDKSSSPKPQPNLTMNNGENMSGLGFENNFSDIVDIPKSSTGRPTLVRKKSDLDKPRVDIPPGATYNPQSSKKVTLPQGRNSSGRNSPRYSGSLKKGFSQPSAPVGSKTNANSFDDSFDTSWAKSSLSQSKGGTKSLQQSDAQVRSSGIPKGHSHRSSFDKNLGHSHSPGRSSLSQQSQHSSSPLRSNTDSATPRTLHHTVTSAEQNADRNILNDTTQDINRQSGMVPGNGNLVNVSSQQDLGGIQKENSGPGTTTLNVTLTHANAEQVHDARYLPSNSNSSAVYGAQTFENTFQIPSVNGTLGNGDKQMVTSIDSQKNMRPDDMFVPSRPANGGFLSSGQSMTINRPAAHMDSLFHSATPAKSKGSAEQTNRPDLALNINNKNTSDIPQSQSSPRNVVKSAIPRPNRPTLNFGSGPASSNKQYTDINARNNNHVGRELSLTNGPAVDIGQQANSVGCNPMAVREWNNKQSYSSMNHPVVEPGPLLMSHVTSPPMITSPPYHALYERQTQSPRSLSSGSPSSVRSQSSTPTPTRPSLNFGSRMTSPGLNLPVRHIPTSISSCDMSFESPDSPGSLSLPGRPSFISSPGSPGGATMPLRPGSAGAPGPLNFSNPGIMRKKKEFHLPMSAGHSRTPDANEIELKYQEIMKRCGILTLDHKRIPTSIHELEHVCDLGHGTCGHVVKMRHVHTGHVMAVKQMRRSGNRDENKRIIMDLDVVVKSHNCPYIVRCIGTFVTSTDVWICMELMSTCLEKLLKKYHAPIPEEILGKVAAATVNALHYLKEEHGVIHRDIKPSNILLNENGDIKLCDFGISGRLVDSKAKTRSAGCAAYMAPERIDPPDPTRPDYDIRADVWSLGISLVELATGAFPYKNCKTDFEVLTRVLQEDPPVLPPGEGFSLDLCSFVFHCLTKDYKKRPKYRELLKHPFIQRYLHTPVDVASWYASVLQKIGPPTPITGNPTKQ